MNNKKGASKIILPNGQPTRPEVKTGLRVHRISFTFEGRRYRMEICDNERFPDAPIEHQTMGLAAELHSIFNLNNLACLALAKDLAEAGIPLPRYKKLAESVGLSVVTEEGEQIEVATNLENL